jgi:hypothetical protein
VTQTAEDLNNRFMYWRTPQNSTAPCKWYVSLCVWTYNIYVCFFLTGNQESHAKQIPEQVNLCVSVMIWLQAA